MPAGAAPAGIGALPAHFEFNAPAAWRAIDFISDLHLSAEMPLTFAAWAAHLRHTPADAVFMLGDLFEVWVGDDARDCPFERSAMDVMAEAASHRQLAFMVGNRDFLLGHAMLRASGLIGLPDPTLLVAWGQRVLLSHGDALCLDDAPYQAFRQMVRSDAWQARFLARPLPERQQLAAEMRRASAGRQRFDGEAGVDADIAEAVRWMHASGAAELVHGHTHRPASHALAPGFKRHVLGDWDRDDAARPRGEVLRLTRDGFQRLPPADG
ncbi:MAG: UDP-2,3-diacylglucosamine diphosphatase [Burkholderiales bacterium]|nr:UDP-2,3-diacylglucosamine diphosphatase [Burkholderiales bacterium]MDE2275178.1 UDP-2,3-diacylglucosamine diphosphatase [Burkholderiales bacterium]